MADYMTAFIKMFGSFVKAIFELPFIGSSTYGYVLLAIYVLGLILLIMGSRLR